MSPTPGGFRRGCTESRCRARGYRAGRAEARGLRPDSDRCSWRRSPLHRPSHCRGQPRCHTYSSLLRRLRRIGYSGVSRSSSNILFSSRYFAGILGSKALFVARPRLTPRPKDSSHVIDPILRDNTKRRRITVLSCEARFAARSRRDEPHAVRCGGHPSPLGGEGTGVRCPIDVQTTVIELAVPSGF
jgi:hypothetical protein